MFDWLEMGAIQKDGTERCCAYEKFGLDWREISISSHYFLLNNHSKNECVIEYKKLNGDISVVLKEKESTMTLNEFKKWLISRGVKDGYMEWLKNNKWYIDKYPQVSGAEIALREG